MKNLTSEQVERLNEVYYGEILADTGEDGLEDTIEDKIDGMWQYLDCAGLVIETEEKVLQYFGIL
ncbi:hypothetical protein [uncultured Clostridium sp.]|uniref:hypothetical protein n=1 Tax=uncultured Clostridium sp. TaxID=59620 RepID=UPI00272E4967|nr:hypothetical protein [uncultured Clostridium sp.]